MKSFQTILILICLVFLGYSIYLNKDKVTGFFFGEPTHLIQIQGVRLFTTLAITPEAKTRGLSGTESLGELEAMLFVFDTNDRHGIWMKDMNYSLDIFWIAEDFEIVHIERRVSPDTYPKSFRPPRPARYVIETNANVAKSFNIHVGDIIILPDSTMKLLSN